MAAASSLLPVSIKRGLRLSLRIQYSMFLLDAFSCKSDAVFWIEHIFGDCVYDTQDLISFILGMLSIACWVIVGFPQIIENYQQQDGESLSVLFLVIWLIGDVFNMIGCVMANQLPTQLYVGIWYTLMDIVLLIQLYYYRWKNRNRTKVHELDSTTTLLNSEEEGGVSASSRPLPISRQSSGGFSLSIDFSGPRSFDRRPRSISPALNISVQPASYIPIQQSQPASIPSSNYHSISLYVIPLFLLGTCFQLLSTVRPDDRHFQTRTLLSFSLTSRTTIQLIGTIQGWLSSVLYVASRLPQLIKNYQRKSTEGLSAFMFVFCVLGNLTYGLSIIIRSLNLGYLYNKLPWLVGSLGTLLFDFLIFLQFFYYKGKMQA